MSTAKESSVNIIAEGTRIEGTISIADMTRFHGVLVGEALGKDGSTLVIAETGMVQGRIRGDTVLVDGFVEGEIHARSRVIVSGTGRVIGKIHSPSLKLEFGAYFEGSSSMEPEVTAGRGPRPA